MRRGKRATRPPATPPARGAPQAISLSKPGADPSSTLQLRVSSNLNLLGRFRPRVRKQCNPGSPTVSVLGVELPSIAASAFGVNLSIAASRASSCVGRRGRPPNLPLRLRASASCSGINLATMAPRTCGNRQHHSSHWRPCKDCRDSAVRRNEWTRLSGSRSEGLQPMHIDLAKLRTQLLSGLSFASAHSPTAPRPMWAQRRNEVASARAGGF